MDKTKGFFALLFGSFCYGINDVIIGIIGKQLSAYQQVFIRTFLGFLVVTLIILITKPKWNLNKIPKVYIFLYAISFPVVVIFFTLGILYSSVASVLFAFYSSVFVFSLLSGIFFFKEKLSSVKILCLFLVFLGLVFFTFPFSKTNINLGFVFGLLAGVIAIVTSSFSKHLGKHLSAFYLTAIQMLGGIIVGLSAVLIFKQSIIPIMSGGIFLLTFLSSIILMLGTLVVVFGFKHFDLNLGAIVISAELFFGPFFAFILLNQSINLFQLIGGIFIAIAISLPHLKLKFQSFHP